VEVFYRHHEFANTIVRLESEFDKDLNDRDDVPLDNNNSYAINTHSPQDQIVLPVAISNTTSNTNTYTINTANTTTTDIVSSQVETQ
jgi:hypothetical protein